MRTAAGGLLLFTSILYLYQSAYLQVRIHRLIPTCNAIANFPFYTADSILVIQSTSKASDVHLDHLTLSVSGIRSDKFLTRDWQLPVGFNNIRMSIITSLLYAQMLNRTLILPSFLYARSCEYGLRCSEFFQEVNFNQASSELRRDGNPCGMGTD